MGLLRRGPEGRLHVEVGSGRVCVVEELQMWGVCVRSGVWGCVRSGVWRDVRSGVWGKHEEWGVQGRSGM